MKEIVSREADEVHQKVNSKHKVMRIPKRAFLERRLVNERE